MNATTPTTIKGSDVNRFQVLALRGALSLECKGMTRRGKSAALIVKEQFGFKGNKHSLLEQLNEWIEENFNDPEE